MRRIARAPIRDQIYEQLLEPLLSGEFRPGMQLKDTELAARLEVSRTPVREALLRLTQEGFLDNPPGRGFKVSPLDAKEICETYPMLWTLESLAVSLATPLEERTLKRLDRLNTRLDLGAHDPLRGIETDADWHRTLVSGCGNDRLLASIEQLRQVVRRYELAYMTHVSRVEESTRDHTEIVALLRHGDVRRIGSLLEDHWRRTMETLSTALQT